MAYFKSKLGSMRHKFSKSKETVSESQKVAV
jgi:hypothetical protein